MTTKISKKFIKDLTVSESEEQQIVVRWFRMTYPKLHLIAYPSGLWLGHNPSTKYAVIGKAKREGWMVGVSDLFLCHSDGKHHGLWLEMKRSKAKVSSLSIVQQQWIKDMNAAGYYAIWAAGADEAIKIITEYINKEYSHGQ
jgi:hypothetical protein